MLDSLDTLIAFVLIMLVVSLLITIAVQMVASLLNLRGWNLLIGLKNTFAVIAPSTGQGISRYAVINRQETKQRKELARYLLKGGLLSDSFLPWWLTIWRHASAIRPGELFDAIHRIAIGKEPASENLKNNAAQLLIALGVDPENIKGANTTITDAQAEADKLKTEAADAHAEVAKILGTLPVEVRIEAQNAMKMVEDAATTVGHKLTAFGTAAAGRAVSIATDLDAAYKKFNYWTCICEERAQQWLTMHTRILTVIFALVFAFWLQLDTVEIFKLVSSNKAVRDKLVAQASAVEAQAAKTLGDSSVVLKDALKAWSAKQTDPAVKNALNGVTFEDTATREEVRDKVAAALNDKKTIDSFDSIVNATATQRLKEQAGNFNAVKADFEKSGFDLFPKDNQYRWGKTWCAGFREHLVGMLFSVGLLSLGAPFWYHWLKDLVSLRSQVAQNISKEQEQTQSQGDVAKPKSPPTLLPA